MNTLGPTVTVQLHRNDGRLPWGFRLQGGRDYRAQLSVKRVETDSPAKGYLTPGDSILAIGGRDSANMSHLEAQQMIKRADKTLSLTLQKNVTGFHDIKPQGPIKFQPSKVQSSYMFAGH